MNTLKDFCPGMRVRIIGARYHAHMIGQTGTVKKAVKRSNTVWVITDDREITPNGVYGAWPQNLEILEDRAQISNQRRDTF
jgi:hypothetical protein